MSMFSWQDGTKLVNVAESIAESFATVAKAYAKKTEQSNIVVNVNYEPGVTTAQDIANAVKNSLRVQDR